jgi:diacylglycerol O-acyltransferase
LTACQNGDRLSWGDALFLYLEREGMPLNIASVSIFEGKISLPALTQFIEAKLPLLPRYYQRVVAPPLNIGFPAWEFDPNFDIHNHIRDVTLKRGTEADLQAMAGRILGTTMDRERPLWDFTLIRGLRGERTAVVVRAHHCLADGIAGVGLMNVLMDPSPEPRPLSRKKPPRQPRRQRDALTSLLDGWISTYSGVIQRVLQAQSDALNIGGAALVAGAWPADEFSRLLPELTAPTERLFFNVTYRGPQKFAWAQVPLAQIRAIKDRCGGTHNDVILTLMTATIRRYAELHGDKVKGRLFRMMVPVSARSNDRPGELGNRISLLPVTVPLGIRNPRRLLAAIHERTDFLKRAHIAEWVGLAGGLLGTAPAPLQAVLGPIASLLPITPFNLVCTNVRGPEFPLYLLGHKMLEWYPYVPVGGEMALNCAVLSYNGVTYFGFSGDAHAAPDLARLEPLLKASLAELSQAAGLEAPPRKKPTKARAKPATVTSSAFSSQPPSGAVPTRQPVAQREEQPAPMAAD